MIPLGIVQTLNCTLALMGLPEPSGDSHDEDIAIVMQHTANTIRSGAFVFPSFPLRHRVRNYGALRKELGI